MRTAATMKETTGQREGEHDEEVDHERAACHARNVEVLAGESLEHDHQVLYT